MMACKFTKKGLISLEWNSKKRKDDVFLAKLPLIHINHECEIEKGVTLLNIMDVVASDEILTKVLAIYSDVNRIEEFHKEVNKPCKKDKSEEYIEIYRTGQIFKNELMSWTEMSGVNTKEKCDRCEDKNYPDHKHYISYDYTPLYKIAKLPVKLNKQYIVRDLDSDKVVINVQQNLTLIEILHAIYYDMSFHGGPKDRDKFCNKAVKESAKAIKEFRKGR